MLRTPLYNCHIAQKATMVNFAGYEMPVKYPQGMIEEHLWVRKACGIFDVSHMGQVIVRGSGLDAVFSRLTPSNFSRVKHSVCKYTVLMNPDGGIIDDLIITKLEDEKFFVVWNASRKNENEKHVRDHFPNIKISVLNNALIAVQGQKTMSAIGKIFPKALEVDYMRGVEIHHPKYGTVFLTRTGYTGEIGFEISIDEKFGEEIWNLLLANEDVRPIGLGARDSLRLEAGYPLYGNDINMQTTPVQASLSWVITKDHSGYIGFEKIFNNDENVQRIGILLEDKGVMRAGYEIFDGDSLIGVLTSGGYSPILEKSIGQAYLNKKYEVGQTVFVKIRDKLFNAKVTPLAFVQTNSK